MFVKAMIEALLVGKPLIIATFAHFIWNFNDKSKHKKSLPALFEISVIRLSRMPSYMAAQYIVFWTISS